MSPMSPGFATNLRAPREAYSLPWLLSRLRLACRVHKCADGLSQEGPFHVAFLAEGEYEDREAVLHGQGYGRGVHHRQTELEHVDVLEALEFPGLGVQVGVGVVHTVHLGALENGLRLDLQSA